MSDPTGIDTILKNLRKLQANTIVAMEQGMHAGADIIEPAAASTTAYKGMSGATRASTIAYVATAQDNGAGEALAAFNTAAGLLEGFLGHEGRAYLALVPGPGPNQMWIVLTVPTDYIRNLEEDNAGAKAFLADTLYQYAPQAFDEVVQALRGVFS